MKIIKKSELIEEQEKPWSIEVQCSGNSKTRSKGCGSTIKVEEEDLKFFRREDKESLQDYLSVFCPACGSILLKPKEVPAYVYIRWFKAHPETDPISDSAEPYAEQNR